MANTRNGYPVKKTRSGLVRRPGPHTPISEGGYRYFADNDVADILADAMWQWHTRIGLVRLWGGWRSPSFNEEQGGNYASNHMSGTATDTNWDKHPYERNFPSGGYHHGFTGKQLNELKVILRLYRDDTGRSIVRSGMDYAPGWVDAMHLETGMYTTGPGGYINVPRSKVRQVANKVRARHRPPRTFAEIEAYQREVGTTADGKHGPSTIKAIRAYQKARNLSQTGLWDEATKNSKDDELMSDAQYRELKALILDNHADIHSLRGERTNAHVKELAEFEDVKKEISLLRNALLAALRDLPEDNATALLGTPINGLSLAWWIRQGEVLDPSHRQYPSDPGSKADLIQQIYEKILGKEAVPYDGSQKREPTPPRSHNAE